MAEPIYTAANCRVAYQLRWSLTLFAASAWPAKDEWWESLRSAVEADGVRLLEYQQREAAVGQFLVSTRPEVSPTEVVRSVKGRLQHIIRDAIPKFWRRHYSIASVGGANWPTLQNYVADQLAHHPLADERSSARLAEFQFHDSQVDLAALRASSHGRFIHSLHIVLENAEHLGDTGKRWLEATRSMLGRACAKKGWLLGRLGLVHNHLHVLLGCSLTDVPCDVALSLMNNLAYAHGIKPVYEFSFYVGTFGPYDHEAIRRRLRAAVQGGLVADQ